VFDVALAAGKTAKTYNESMTGNCSLNGASAYDYNHNPRVYYTDSGPAANCLGHDVPSGTTTFGRAAQRHPRRDAAHRGHA
jgi:hypothetical protein